MSVIRQDDRTSEQLKTHTYLVTATDIQMSGWGKAKGGLSKCAWAFDSFDDAEECYEIIRKRAGMKYVNIRTTKWYPRAAHVHIYVVSLNCLIS
tara:strand:+ start:605 stop:886 length:282 start_codon:yes stop_codon:yes gene_type:complete